MPKKTWRDQFRDSQREWSIRECGDGSSLDPDTSIDKLLANYFGSTKPEFEERNDLVAEGLRSLVRQQVDRTYLDLEAVYSMCESPIETPMLLALSLAGRNLEASVTYRVRGRERGDLPDDFLALFIEPQAELGDYRVDFLVEYRERGPDYENKKKTRDGRTVVGTKTETRHVIVECDGHDYHDRTKEQASRDRERDRVLQTLGYPVFRYTGADIWKDVFKCAEEAVNFAAQV